MSEFLFGVLIFLTGSCFGFLVASMLAVGRLADRDEPFDGGFSTEYPPARTRIWSAHVKSEPHE